jgi:ankyrin repeat protein
VIKYFFKFFSGFYFYLNKTGDNLELKEHVNLQSTKHSYTPLHVAAMSGSVSIVECLINEYEAEKELIDYKNRTPLHEAAEYSK